MDENSNIKNLNPPLNENITHDNKKDKCCPKDKDTDSENFECLPPKPPLHPKPHKPPLHLKQHKPPKPPLSPPHNKPHCSSRDDDKIDITYLECQMVKTETREVTLNCIGRLLDIDVVLKNVCPNKFVAVGVLVYENNKLLSVKVCKLSTGDGHNCIPNLNAGKFSFVFEDDPCPKSRSFNVKIIANYIEKPHVGPHPCKEHH